MSDNRDTIIAATCGDEMYPDIGVDQIIYSADEDAWPFVNDVSCVTIVTSASDWIAIGSEIVIVKYAQCLD